MAATLVVEAEQIALRVLPAAVVVGADLGDLAVADQEPLGAAIEACLAGLRVAPGHRPLDRDLVAFPDRVLQMPAPLDVGDRVGRVAADRLGSFVRAETRVVVDRVIGEVRRNGVRVARVEGLVIRPDVVYVAQIP